MKKNIEQILNETIIDVKDFPKKGIIFKDLTPILSNNEVYRKVIKELYKQTKGLHYDCILSAESRGFWFAIPLAMKAKVSFIPCRKPGKLPRKVITESYDLEYGKNELSIHEGDIKPGSRVLIIDDLVATSGTANAMVKLVERSKATVAGCAFVFGLKQFNPKAEIQKVSKAPCIILSEI